MMFVFSPEGMSPEAKAVLAVTLWVATWWITEAIPIPVTSLLPIFLLPVTGAMDGNTVTSSYGDDIIFLFLGGFFIATAMEKWNLHKRMAMANYCIHRYKHSDEFYLASWLQQLFFPCGYQTRQQ